MVFGSLSTIILMDFCFGWGVFFLWIFSSASYRDCLTLGIESGTASMEMAHSDGCPFSGFLLAVFHRFLAKTQKKPKPDETMMDTSIDSNAGGDLPNKKIDVTDAQDGGVAPRNRE